MIRKSFLLVGSGGYIAPRHVKAIQAIQGDLLGCVDIKFTKEALEMLPSNTIKASSIAEFKDQNSQKIDYMVICSPNFLHEEHIKKGLEMGLNIISEKPLALDSEGLKRLEIAEAKSSGSIFSILQLRLHPVVQELRELVESLSKSSHEIDLKYIAKRDSDYFESWKGDLSLSGGLLLNVGVHYFDLLLSIFGDCNDIVLLDHSNRRSEGSLILEKGKVNWLFSFEEDDIEQYVIPGESAFRTVSVDGQEVEFSQVAEDLHTESYKKILNNEGYTLNEARRSIELVDLINKTEYE